ncbi:alpha/beta fold hydrolase [Ktedonosporobacter rubrisoli]|uniref:Alpha/beta fold hydrolase n=1 Tax=Ktedonosporobacter rubrisoli TaxID=2509675 RepID=A0A4P6K1B9_KTERU|nr:alpha/beta fold hydrolase [Ktedonosporobacter rubrisoli]QBD81236.1 alpha/beta fold hydrolase [Ktedonosporobacter rubrisoli]
MNTYVFVHGEWHGGWCWHKVVPLLSQAGHKAVAFDLPGHGQDKTSLLDVTLESYIRRACQVVEAQSGPVILVGHGMAGLVLSEVAEACPQKIKTLVYLSAFLLPNGHSFLESVARDPHVPPPGVMDATGTFLTLPEDKLIDMLYNDCCPSDIEDARRHITPEPFAPMLTPIHITVANFGSMPRIYIQTLRDQMLPLSSQKRFYTTVPCHKILSLNTGHAPFYSAPQDLVKHLLSL